MSLLTFKAPVDYAAQQGHIASIPPSWKRWPLFQAAFEDFLTSYKCTVTSEQLAADALQDLNIDEDGLSDEYDFMDDVTNEKERRRRTGHGTGARRKYMDMLQKVADRETSQITVELDDLDNVSSGAKDLSSDGQC